MRNSWFFLMFLAGNLLVPAKGWNYPDELAGTVSLSVQPQVIRVGPTSRYIYVLDSTSPTVSVVDTLFFKEIRTVSFSGSPRDIQISKNGDTLYTLSSDADIVTAFDLEDDLSLPQNPTTLSMETSNVIFDELEIGNSSNADLLVLSSKANNAVYLFDRSTESLRLSGAEDHIDVGAEPSSMRLTPNGDRVVILDSNANLRTYLTSSALQAGSTIDLTGFTSSSSFSHVGTGTIGIGDFGFLSNAISSGEVFLLNLSSSGFSIFVQDADPTSSSSTEPIFVEDGPSGSLVASVNRAKDDPSTTGVYLFVANRTSGSLSIVDTADIAGSEKVEPIDTISSVSDVSAKGLGASSINEGYVYAANVSGSSISVITDQPFLTLSSLPSSSVGNTDVNVTVNSTQGGSLTVLQYTGEKGEVISDTAGTVLATDTLEANTDKILTFSAVNLEEGDNDIAFFLKNGDFLGRTAFTLTKDTPPAKPKSFKLLFGNEKIFARWERSSESDMSHYLLFFGTSENTTGGVGSLTSPTVVEHPSSGDIEHILEPVSNGTLVFARVVAVDQTGNQSESTETLSETAEETIGILGLSGELGGCAANPNGAFLILLILINLCLVFHAKQKFRTREFVLGIIFLSSLIRAQTAFSQTIATDQEPRNVDASAEFRVAWWVPKDSVLKSFFGKGGNEIYMLRFGVVWSRLDFGVEGGILHESSRLIGVSSGRQSGESTGFTLVPIEFSTQYNLHWSQKPIFVPFIRAGYDLIYFDVSEPTNSVSGTKHAVTTAVGLRVLLEELASSNDPKDLLGLKHFFLEAVVSYRHQFSSGLDFGGWLFQPGIGIIF